MVSFRVRSQAPVALGKATVMADEPFPVHVPAGHVTLRERGTVDGQETDTCIDPAPVNV
jgi:hypothetical protein